MDWGDLGLIGGLVVFAFAFVLRAAIRSAVRGRPPADEPRSVVSGLPRSEHYAMLERIAAEHMDQYAAEQRRDSLALAVATRPEMWRAIGPDPTVEVLADWAATREVAPAFQEARPSIDGMKDNLDRKYQLEVLQITAGNRAASLAWGLAPEPRRSEAGRMAGERARASITRLFEENYGQQKS